MSSFSSLSTALSGLYAGRRGLDVTGQNIANANTEGYSRQRVDLEAVGGPTVPALFATWRGAGAGVTVGDVNRVRDTFLEARGRTEHAQNSYLTDRQQIHARIEQLFGEPSDTGLQSQLADLWSGWHDVANRPDDLAARTQLLQRGATVADSLRTGYRNLASLWSSAREQLDALTTEVNTTATTVAQLNEAVVSAEAAGVPANELADQRDQLVLKLSQLTGATARSRDDGSVDVFLAGSALVSGAAARQLDAIGAGRLEDQAADPVNLRWRDTGTSAAVPSGRLASVLETLGTTLPHYAAQLDTVAATLAGTVNAQHAAGFDLAGAAGGPFYTGTTAATITAAITDPAKVAASDSAGGNLSGENADAIAGLADATGGADRAYRQVVVDLGVAAQTVNRRAGIQSVITADVDAARSAQSGVSLDEEMTNMLNYQRAYDAAARVLTAIDSALDTLINRTGLVGR